MLIHPSARHSVSSARRAVLESRSLEFAPAAVQRAFWRHYNYGMRRSRSAAVLVGELAAKCVEGASAASPQELERIAEAWMRSVPPAFLGATRLETYERGRLRVTVDGAATKFVLARQLHDALLAALNADLAGLCLESIEFRVGAIGGVGGRNGSTKGYKAAPSA